MSPAALQFYFYLAIGIVVWHICMLNSFSLYTGMHTKTWGLAPKDVIFSRAHKRGIAFAFAGYVVIVASEVVGWLGYGMFAGGALVLCDCILTYRAFRRPHK